MANASSCFTPLRVVACCCKDCILARQAPRERRPQTPHSLPSLFCLFYPTIAIATLQSLNPENATPTSKQPKLCTLSLQKKTRERERERERERGFGFLCADVRKDLQHYQSRQIEKDEKTRVLSHLRKWGFGEKRSVTLSGVYAFLTRVVWNRLTTIYTFRRVLLCCIDRRRSRSWGTVYFAKHRKLGPAFFNKNDERSAIAAGLCRYTEDAEEICFVLEYVLKNSTNSSRTLESTRTVFQIRKPSQIISRMIIIGCIFFAISLTISSDHLAQSALVAHFVQFL
jgi:hypothetical protein